MRLNTAIFSALIFVMVAALPASLIEDKLPGARRTQLIGSETVLPEVEGESTDPADITPVPIEMPDAATHLPEGMELVVPFEGRFRISNGYGFESRSWTHQTIGNLNSANDFYAVDVACPTGTPVRALAAGRIMSSGLRDDSYGNYIVIDHGNGITSVYAHLSELAYEVEHGEPEVDVEAGDQIGLTGSSGTSSPHLHFAVHTDSHLSVSGADVGGVATVPEPVGGRYGLRAGQMLGEE